MFIPLEMFLRCLVNLAHLLVYLNLHASKDSLHFSKETELSITIVLVHKCVINVATFITGENNV